jgi:hypothetical protein
LSTLGFRVLAFCVCDAEFYVQQASCEILFVYDVQVRRCL